MGLVSPQNGSSEHSGETRAVGKGRGLTLLHLVHTKTAPLPTPGQVSDSNLHAHQAEGRKTRKTLMAYLALMNSLGSLQVC
jgi:hypothetical protein